MRSSPGFTASERAVLWTVAAIGGLGLNGVFLYTWFTRPNALATTLADPIAMAFIAEALLLVPVLAWLLGRWGVSRRPWPWFVVLSMLGGLAFALPVVLLWGRDREAAREGQG